MRICRPFLATFLFLCCALYLRAAKGSVVREWVTSLLGYEWRAIVEHALAGLGLPLMLSLLLFGVFRNLGKHPSSDRAQQIMLLCIFVLFAAGYAVGSYLFEQGQAFSGVYGGAPRGYFQYGQWYADIMGLILAAGYVLLEIADHRRQSSNSFKPMPPRGVA